MGDSLSSVVRYVHITDMKSNHYSSLIPIRVHITVGSTRAGTRKSTAVPDSRSLHGIWMEKDGWFDSSALLYQLPNDAFHTYLFHRDSGKQTVAFGSTSQVSKVIDDDHHRHDGGAWQL